MLKGRIKEICFKNIQKSQPYFNQIEKGFQQTLKPFILGRSGRDSNPRPPA